VDMSRIFSVLWRSKWLFATGLIVAVLAAVTAGYRVENGSLEPRAERSFTASTLVMLSGAGIPLYQAEAASPAAQAGVAAPREQDLSTAAVMFAYIISGSTIRDEVAEQIGALSPEESISAVQRTTQPSGSERFPGRLNLPIVEIQGTASTPERAAQLAETATASFRDYVTEQQEAASLDPDARVVLADIRDAVVAENDVSNTLAPLIAVWLGTLLAFIALIFILDNARRTRITSPRRSAKDPASTETDEAHQPALFPDLEPIDGAAVRGDEVLEPAARR
jgi:hypothetical protein